LVPLDFTWPAAAVASSTSSCSTARRARSRAALLGHRTPNMSIICSTPSDPTVEGQ
jgi:hypothetical protein